MSSNIDKPAHKQDANNDSLNVLAAPALDIDLKKSSLDYRMKSNADFKLKSDNYKSNDNLQLNVESNIDHKVLEPSAGSLMKPNMPSSSTKSSMKGSKLGGVLPLKEPSMTPETLKKVSAKDAVQSQNVDVLPMPFKKIPEGVVPVPSENLFAPPTNKKDDDGNVDDNKDDMKKVEDDKNDIPDEINAALPGRYRNNIIDNDNDLVKSDQKLFNEEKENGAQEVFDFPGKIVFSI